VFICVQSGCTNPINCLLCVTEHSSLDHTPEFLLVDDIFDQNSISLTKIENSKNKARQDKLTKETKYLEKIWSKMDKVFENKANEIQMNMNELKSMLSKRLSQAEVPSEETCSESCVNEMNSLIQQNKDFSILKKFKNKAFNEDDFKPVEKAVFAKIECFDFKGLFEKEFYNLQDIKDIQWKLVMSGRWATCQNTFEALQSIDLSVGAGTQNDNLSYVQASFDFPVRVEQVSLGVANLINNENWTSWHLNGAILENSNDGENWNFIEHINNFQDNEIRDIKFKPRVAQYWRIRRQGYLAIGHLRFA